MELIVNGTHYVLNVSVVPPWAWWTIGIAAWYVMAALVLRYSTVDAKDHDTEVQMKCECWMFSPILFPFALFLFIMDVVLTRKGKK